MDITDKTGKAIHLGDTVEVVGGAWKALQGHVVSLHEGERPTLEGHLISFSAIPHNDLDSACCVFSKQLVVV